MFVPFLARVYTRSRPCLFSFPHIFVPATQEELREARRQQRKLNFLITQTELYSHFLAKKLGASGDAEAPAPTPAPVPQFVSTLAPIVRQAELDRVKAPL